MNENKTQTEAFPEPEEPKSKGGRPKNNPGIEAWTGAALRVRRVARDLTATQLGDLIGVSQSTVIRWENGDAPTEAKVTALSELFGCGIDAFSRDPVIG